MGIHIKDMLGNLFPQRKKRRKAKVPEALQLLLQEEAQKLIDMDNVVKEAIQRVEQAGIIFLDELDKIAGRERSAGPDVSREGVQRDLIPERQGRFPIRVELQALGRDDFVRILREPQNALIKQYKALLATEGITLDFTDDAIDELADIAERVNQQTENIGARRLYTILERLLDGLSFTAPDRSDKGVSIDRQYVSERLEEVVKSEDLSHYIL